MSQQQHDDNGRYHDGLKHAYTIHGLVVVSVGEGAVRVVALAAVLLALLGQDVVVVLSVLVLDVVFVMVVLS